MDNLELKRAVTFAILMQGVKDKAPIYMMEKWKYVHGCFEEDELLGILDHNNRYLYQDYKRMWNVE